jgi:hypothetical protein
VAACSGGSATVVATSANVGICNFGSSALLARVQFSGLMTATTSTQSTYQTDPRGSAFSGGCIEGVNLWTNAGYDKIVPVPSAGCPAGGYVPGGPYTVYANVKGSTFAKWSGSRTGNTYSGSFTVTVTRIEGTATLTADRHFLSTPGGVTFRVIPGTGPTGAPFTVTNLSWSWTPATSPNPASVCGLPLTCTPTVASSGTMTVAGLANGTPFTGSTAIVVANCPPTGDPWLDLIPGFKDTLYSELDRSNPGAPEGSRRERVGAWYSNNTSGAWTYLPIAPTYADNCGNEATYPSMNGWSLEIAIHTHPNQPGTPVTVCGSMLQPTGGSYAPGPSRQDWAAVDTIASQEGHPTRLCTIGTDGAIHCFNSGVPGATRDDSIDKFTQRPEGCYQKETAP